MDFTKVNQLHKKIRELEAGLYDNEETINEMNEDLGRVKKENMVMSSVIEKQTYDIIAIKKTINSQAGLSFEWNKKTRKAREEEERGGELGEATPSALLGGGSESQQNHNH